MGLATMNLIHSDVSCNGVVKIEFDYFQSFFPPRVL